MAAPSSIRSLLLAAALPFAGGCAFTHRCAVPEPVAEAAPTGKIPLSVAIRHLPPPGRGEVAIRRDPYHTWVVDPAPPTRALFGRLASSIFERTVPAPVEGGAPGADVVLEIRVDDVRYAWQPVGFGPYSAEVAYRATLRTADDREIAAFALAGEGARAPVFSIATHCKGIGDAVALAMQDAGAKLIAGLSSDPAFLAWLGARGIAPPSAAVRSPESYAAPAAPPTPPVAPGPGPTREQPVASPATEAPTDTSAVAERTAPRPVTAPGPTEVPAPRSIQVRVGIGLLVPEETEDQLEAAGMGTHALLAAEWRPVKALGLTLDFGGMFRSFSPRTLPPSGGLAVATGITLRSASVGLGVRGILSDGPIEPWVGASVQAVRTELSTTYSLVGFPGSGEPSDTAWSTGIDLGAGLQLYIGGRWYFGAELRRLFSRASLAPFTGDTGVGGLSTSLTVGASLF